MVFGGFCWVVWGFFVLFSIVSAGPVIQFEVAIKITREVYPDSFKILLLFQINTTVL